MKKIISVTEAKKVLEDGFQVQDLNTLRDGIENVKASLEEALDAATNIANANAGTALSAQIKAYLIPTLESFINSNSQGGSIPNLLDTVDEMESVL